MLALSVHQWPQSDNHIKIIALSKLNGLAETTAAVKAAGTQRCRCSQRGVPRNRKFALIHAVQHDGQHRGGVAVLRQALELPKLRPVLEGVLQMRPVRLQSAKLELKPER